MDWLAGQPEDTLSQVFRSELNHRLFTGPGTRHILGQTTNNTPGAKRRKCSRLLDDLGPEFFGAESHALG